MGKTGTYVVVSDRQVSVFTTIADKTKDVMWPNIHKLEIAGFKKKRCFIYKAGLFP